jgi:uncharacterized protein HemY
MAKSSGMSKLKVLIIVFISYYIIVTKVRNSFEKSEEWARKINKKIKTAQMFVHKGKMLNFAGDFQKVLIN